jgi:transposase
MEPALWRILYYSSSAAQITGPNHGFVIAARVRTQVQDNVKEVYQMKNRVIAIYGLMRLRCVLLISEIFGVGASFFKNTLKSRREEGGPLPRNKNNEASLLNEEQLEALKVAVEICPDATLDELRRIVSDDCGRRVSLISVCRALNTLNLPPVRRSGNVYNFRPTAREKTSR